MPWSSTGTDLFRTTDGLAWRKTPAPAGAAPARALVAAGPGRVYLAGWRGLYRSDDGGATWTDITAGIPQDARLRRRARGRIPRPCLRRGRRPALVEHRRRRDMARSGPRDPGRPRRDRGARARDAGAAVGGRDGRGCTEATTEAGPGEPGAGTLGRRPSRLRALAVGPRRARRWFSPRTAGSTASTRPGAGRLMADTLPAHLEAWPLVRDPGERATLYAGFALVPYLELWRLAAERRTSLAGSGPMGLAGGAAFLLLLALSGAVAFARSPATTARWPVPAGGSGILGAFRPQPRPGDTSGRRMTAPGAGSPRPRGAAGSVRSPWRPSSSWPSGPHSGSGAPGWRAGSPSTGCRRGRTSRRRSRSGPTGRCGSRSSSPTRSASSATAASSGSTRASQNFEPLGLAVDAGGPAWYTDGPQRMVGRVTPDGGRDLFRPVRRPSSSWPVWPSRPTVPCGSRRRPPSASRASRTACSRRTRWARSARPRSAWPSAADGTVWGTIPRGEQARPSPPDWARDRAGGADPGQPAGRRRRGLPRRRVVPGDAGEQDRALR